MDAIHLVVVSDTHLSSRAPEGLANWEAVVRHVAATDPDLIVHLGDVTLDGAYHPQELQDARQLLDRLPVPWRAVPGNHDIGDNPWRGAPDDSGVNPGRLVRWAGALGPDRWALDIKGWTLIALNAQLFGSGLDAETTQWKWLEGQLARVPSGRPMVVLTHKPLTAAAAELAASPPYRFVPPAARLRLGRLLGDRPVPLIVSGHVHQFRSLRLGDRHNVWAPTTWAVLPERAQPTLGTKRCGVLSIVLGGDGHAEADLIEPAGVAQLTLTHDIPDPYRS